MFWHDFLQTCSCYHLQPFHTFIFHASSTFTITEFLVKKGENLKAYQPLFTYEMDISKETVCNQTFFGKYSSFFSSFHDHFVFCFCHVMWYCRRSLRNGWRSVTILIFWMPNHHQAPTPTPTPTRVYLLKIIIILCMLSDDFYVLQLFWCRIWWNWIF